MYTQSLFDNNTKKTPPLNSFAEVGRRMEKGRRFAWIDNSFEKNSNDNSSAIPLAVEREEKKKGDSIAWYTR